uniref:LRRCT domain-containing protein n=1 Tax=Megaselia scalaris TaxID=36166 RepID=T1GKB0_MEGSC
MELQLQNNLIEIIEQESFSTLRNLQELNIQNNKLLAIDEILPNTPNASLQILQLNHNNIVEIHLKSFQNLENITILRLNDNKLRRIDKSLLVDMKKLEKIYLSNNEISEIEKDAFTTIRYLRFLDLSRNRLKHIRKEFFVNLVELEELIMAENYIDTIDSFSFRALKKLKVLDLSGNRLVSITKDIFQFQNDLSSLTQLNLRNCSLQRIEANSFKSLTNLNDINLEENHLKAMDVQSLDIPSLHSLKLSGNNFLGGGEILSGMFDKLRKLQYQSFARESIPEEHKSSEIGFAREPFTELIRGIFSGLNVFKELRLCRNNLSDFPHIALYNISTLELLTLSGNYLTAIDFFKLSGTLNLRHLDLRDNRISLLQGFNAVNLTQLDYIDLSGNSLASLPRNFLQHSINLQRVDLSENRFLQIPSSVLSDTSLPRLQWLNLTGNPIDTIYTVKEERYPYLKELYICGTSLTILTSKDFEAFQALQHLHLIRNRINRISPGAFKSLSNLLTLDVSVNELEKLPKERLQGLKSLRLLNISHNSLRDLEEFSSDLEQLQICDLSYNQLDNIDTKVFHNLKGLIELHLVGNRLTVIYSDAFRYLSKLQILDLRKNYFEVVPLEALKPLETNVRTLKIEENPLHCSCETQQLWEWLRDHRKWTTDDNVNYLRCEQPDELRAVLRCSAYPKIAIQDIQPFSVVVSWQNQQNFGLTGYEVLYHELDGDGKEDIFDRSW